MLHLEQPRPSFYSNYYMWTLVVQHCSCQTPYPVHFDCPKLPPLPPARTVYELRPQDIRVVMALGDSVTAGMELSWNILDFQLNNGKAGKL